MDDAAEPWDSRAEGVVVLPSGRRVRGRGLRKPLAVGPAPAFGLYLSGREPDPTPWPWRWLPWPDFRLPADESETREARIDLWRRAAEQRVEVACGGGRGRTGTALACLAVLDGVPACEASTRHRGRHHRSRGHGRGPSVSPGVTPGRLYLVDTSAFARIGQGPARQVLATIVADHAAATCVTVDLEAGYLRPRRGRAPCDRSAPS